MNRRLIVGIISGIVLTEILFAAQPEHAAYYYIAVMAGAAVASWISGSIPVGLVVAGYVLVWKITGVLLMANAYGLQTAQGNILTFFLDEVMVFLAGAAGAGFGVFMRKFKVVRKGEADTA